MHQTLCVVTKFDQNRVFQQPVNLTTLPCSLPAGGGFGLLPPPGGGWEGGKGPKAGEAIAAVARSLNELRDNWLNPPEWGEGIITPEEERAGYPRRLGARPGFERELKQRTPTNLHNQRPSWRAAIHRERDRAVAQSDGWSDYTPDMPDAEILRRMLQHNRQRAGEGA